jgi:hypothetical protein
MTLPNFLIIGAPKAGTTSLYHNLKAHPQVYMSSLKEVHFFSEESSQLKEGLKYYESLFEDVVDELSAGEASTGYLFSPETPERIKSVVPDVKLIAILRNPVERIYSHYWMKRRRDTLNIETKSGGIADHFSQLIERPEIEDFVHAFYWQSLSRYLQLFDRSQIKVCLFEDLQQDPQNLYLDICTFLNVDRSLLPKASGRIYNKGGDAKNSSLFNLFESLRNRYAKTVSNVLPTSIYEKSRYLYARFRENFMISDYAPLPNGVRQALVNLHREDTLQLQDFLGRDLSHWLV